MEKCWFVLRQKHYPPPQNGEGPLQLGHLIADLKHLDQVINYEPGPHPRPRAMAVWRTVLEDLRWKFQNGHDFDFSVHGLIPIPQTAGLVSAGGRAGILFRDSVANFWQFKSLDSEIIQPTTGYIKDSLKNDLVQDYIQKNKSILHTWSLYMITGLAIARSAQGTHVEKKEWKVEGGPDVAVGGLGQGGLNAGVGKADAAESAFGKSSDFIWAVRLSKISKHLFASDLSHATYFEGATYAAEDEEDAKEMLLQEGIGPEQMHVEEGEEETVFVLPE